MGQLAANESNLQFLNIGGDLMLCELDDTRF